MPEFLRYFNVPKAIWAGATSPVRPGFRELVDSQLKKVDCEEFNPSPKDMLPELIVVIDGFGPNKTMSGLKKDLGITRSDLMIYCASFADDNELNINCFSPFTDGAVRLIEGIENTSKSRNSPIGAPEQLELALKIAKGDITKAVIYLTLGTRVMARKLDRRIFENLDTNDERVYSWKEKIAPFGFGAEFEDTAGDTYHFWHYILAGISREEKVDPLLLRKPKQLICDWVYPNTARATNFLRHKLYLGIMDGWNTHELVDKLGYMIGRMFVVKYAGQNNHVAQSY